MRRFVLLSVAALLLCGCDSDNGKQWTIRDYLKNPGHTPVKNHVDDFLRKNDIPVVSDKSDHFYACLSNIAYENREEKKQSMTVDAALSSCLDRYKKDNHSLDKMVDISEFLAAYDFTDKYSDTAFIKNEIKLFLQVMGMNEYSYQFSHKDYKLNFKKGIPVSGQIDVSYKSDNRRNLPMWQITGLKFIADNGRLIRKGYDVKLLTY